jgi:CheY-like chemotaxis protein
MPKVMLVEDDNNLREIYEARLQAEGYTIVSAKDGEEALVIAKAEKPDLIISDVMMPKISGFEMLDILRNTDGLKEVKVIMLTALCQSDDQQRADKLGADRYLVKSQVTLEDIVKVTHDLLEGGGAEEAAPSTVAETPVPPAAAEPAAPAADVPPTPTPAPATDGVAQSSAQEEASVEAKIEDFVAGATTDAAPADASTADSGAVATPAADAGTTAAAADDNLMNNAVDKLMANTSSSDAATTESTVAEPTTAPPAPASPATDAAPEPAEVGVGGTKKIIKPLDSSAKPDIDTLVALEEAKEQASGEPPAPKPVIGSDDGKPSSADPNNIAL